MALPVAGLVAVRMDKVRTVTHRARTVTRRVTVQEAERLAEHLVTAAIPAVLNRVPLNPYVDIME
jgi:hypothetical protein